MFTPVDFLGVPSSYSKPTIYIRRVYRYDDGRTFEVISKKHVSYAVWQRYKAGDKYP